MTSSHHDKLISLDDASEKLMTFFPDLRELYGREVDWWQPEKPEPYVVYEDIFYPYIEKLLASNDTNALQRAFDFIEVLVTANDTRLHDLARIAILTRLTVDPALLAEARGYMGPATKAALDQVQNS
jgi:hypothetical protein